MRSVYVAEDADLAYRDFVRAKIREGIESAEAAHPRTLSAVEARLRARIRRAKKRASR